MRAPTASARCSAAGAGAMTGSSASNALVEPLESGLALAWFGGDRWHFDDTGRPVLIDGGPGRQVRMTHDAEGRLVGARARRGPARRAASGIGDRIVAAAASDGRRVTYGYDDGGNLVAVEHAGAVRRYAIGDDGLIASVTDADGVVEAANVYDEEGRVVEQLSPFGRRTRLAYLPGRVTVTSDDQGGPANTFVHDDQGRLLAIVDGDDQRLSCNYDQWGNPVVITQRGGGVTIQEWDERSRLRAPRPARGRDPDLRLRRRRPHDRERHVDGRDDTDALRRRGADPGRGRRSRGRRHRVHRRGRPGRRRSSTPTACGCASSTTPTARSSRRSTPRATSTRVERDAAGRMTATISPLGRRTELELRRARPDRRAARSVRRRVALRAHERWAPERGRRSRRRARGDSLRRARAARRDDRRARVRPRPSATTSSATSSRRPDPDGATTRYEYDALMRLTTAVDPLGGSWRQEHDADGNLVATVDPAGTRRSRTVDPAGNVTALHDGLAWTSFALDDLGRAIEQRRPDGAIVRCEYDHRGLRTLVEDALGGTLALRSTAPAAGWLRVDCAERSRRALRVRLLRPPLGVHRRRGAALAPALRRRRRAGRARRAQRRDDAPGLRRGRAAGRAVGARAMAATRYGYDAAGRTTLIEDRDGGARRFEYDAGGPARRRHRRQRRDDDATPTTPPAGCSRSSIRSAR